MSVQLSDLGKRIMLDRYAMKDLERKVVLGDTVVYRIDGDTRWGTIDTITNVGSEAKLGIREFNDSSNLIYLNVDQVDRCLETTWEQIMNRVVEGLRERTTVTTGINSTSAGVGAGMLNSLYTNGKRETDIMWNRMQEILNEQRFVPAGRILAGCGTDQELTFYNCFVLPSPEDSRHGIFKTLDQMAEIMSRGGGVGINLATLRPQRAPVYGVNGRSSGSVSWGGLYSFVTGLIEQGGSRRGALMLILPIWHPDIEQFIESKTTAGKIENANISVAITDDFMKAVEEDSDWYLVFPDYKTVSRAEIDWTYDEEWDGNLAEWIAGGGPTKTYKKVRARDLWEKIMQSAWASAEPGIWFIDRANKLSPSWGYGGPHLSIATNPCGEQNLPGWAVCNLGHINLAQHVYGPIGRAKIDWANLEETIILSVNFLDRVIDVTGYYSRESYDKQMDYRRVGLGTLGLGEMLVRCGYVYGSPDGNSFISELYQKICDIAWETSCKLGKQKGSHGIFDRKKFEASDWFQKIHSQCRRFREAYDAFPAMRNITVLTQAPCGTVATMIGTTTGIEPYFAFSNTRVSRLGTHKEVAGVVKEWETQVSSVERQRVIDLPEYFVTTMDLTPLQHVKVQSIIQKWTDTSISKTVNLPNSATVDQVREVYEYMYQMGCKGGTVYRDGSRSEQVLYTEVKTETKSVSSTNGGNLPVDESKSLTFSPPGFDLEKIKEAGKIFEVQKASRFGRKGTTMSRRSPSGIVHIIMNDDDNGDPFECFVEVGKSGSEVKGLSEALGRLISIVMRMPSSMSSKAKVMEVINQLQGIGGMSSIGAGPNRSLSIPDSVADALNTRYFDSPDVDPEDPAHPVYELLENPQRVSADLCPKCHNSGLTRSEGCQVCINCGHSACG